jgi:hypothetical protein
MGRAATCQKPPDRWSHVPTLCVGRWPQADVQTVDSSMHVGPWDVTTGGLDVTMCRQQWLMWLICDGYMFQARPCKAQVGPDIASCELGSVVTACSDPSGCRVAVPDGRRKFRCHGPCRTMTHGDMSHGTVRHCAASGCHVQSL